MNIPLIREALISAIGADFEFRCTEKLKAALEELECSKNLQGVDSLSPKIKNNFYAVWKGLGFASAAQVELSVNALQRIEARALRKAALPDNELRTLNDSMRATLVNIIDVLRDLAVSPGDRCAEAAAYAEIALKPNIQDDFEKSL